MVDELLKDYLDKNSKCWLLQHENNNEFEKRSKQDEEAIKSIFQTLKDITASLTLIENRMALKTNCDNNIHKTKELEKRIDLLAPDFESQLNLEKAKLAGYDKLEKRVEFLELDAEGSRQRETLHVNRIAELEHEVKPLRDVEFWQRVQELEKKLSDLQSKLEDDEVILRLTSSTTESLQKGFISLKMKEKVDVKPKDDFEGCLSCKTVPCKCTPVEVAKAFVERCKKMGIKPENDSDIIQWKGKKYKVLDEHSRIDNVVSLCVKEVVDEKPSDCKCVEYHVLDSCGTCCKKQELEKLEFQGSIYEFRVRGNGWRIFAQPLQKYIKPDDIIMEYDFDNLIALEKAVLKAKSLREARRSYD